MRLETCNCEALSMLTNIRTLKKLFFQSLPPDFPSHCIAFSQLKSFLQQNKEIEHLNVEFVLSISTDQLILKKDDLDNLIIGLFEFALTKLSGLRTFYYHVYFIEELNPKWKTPVSCKVWPNKSDAFIQIIKKHAKCGFFFAWNYSNRLTKTFDDVVVKV